MRHAPTANATVVLRVGVGNSVKRKGVPVCSISIARGVVLVTALLRRVTAILDGLDEDVKSQLAPVPQCAAPMERARRLD